MSWTSDLQSVKKSRKPHRCHWCGEAIPAGSAYSRWACTSDGGRSLVAINVHPECLKAWERAIQLDDEYRYGVTPGDHARGCLCDNGNCRCGAKENVDGGTDPVQGSEHESHSREEPRVGV